MYLPSSSIIDRMQHKVSFKLSTAGLNSNFPCRLLAVPRIKIFGCPTIYPWLGEKRTDTFFNVNSLVQN